MTNGIIRTWLIIISIIIDKNFVKTIFLVNSSMHFEGFIFGLLMEVIVPRFSTMSVVSRTFMY
jgi:hypothetical protein